MASIESKAEPNSEGLSTTANYPLSQLHPILIDSSSDSEDHDGEDHGEDRGEDGSDSSQGSAPPLKRMRPSPGKGAPRVTPCAPCILKMVEHGAQSLCRDQTSTTTVMCYTCCGRKRKCGLVPLAAVPAAHALQAAANRILRGETVNNWNALASDAKQALQKAENERGSEPITTNPAALHSIARHPTARRPAPRRLASRHSAIRHSAFRRPIRGLELPDEAYIVAIDRTNELIRNTNTLLARILSELVSLRPVPE
ncbi:hypothetical protein EDB80DRAFT_884208 [Ilyonectria destructans]|nr:hypothetical protein EDB80DRAFT_884208 [Ilyonectria destructans]